MAISPVNTRTPTTAKVPNKREKAASQHGTFDSATPGDWAGTSPDDIKEAIDRLAAAFAALLTQLESESLSGSYDPTLKP